MDGLDPGGALLGVWGADPVDGTPAYVEDGRELRSLAAGRIGIAHATIDRWFEFAAEHDGVSVELRETVAQAGRTIFDEAARALGSRPFATGTALDRARRDFELFVLQHRLDPAVVRLGRERVGG